MLCYAKLCYAMLCYAILCYAILRGVAGTKKVGGAPKKIQGPIFLVLRINDGFSENNINTYNESK